MRDSGKSRFCLYFTRALGYRSLGLFPKKAAVRAQAPDNTSDMLFGISEILAYFSTHMALLPGDLIATGTPPGVGFGKNRFLAVGDVLECGISHLGAQRHEIGL